MLYIAGPMTGHHEFNYPAFRVAADALTRAGYTVAHTGSLAALSFLTATGTAPKPADAYPHTYYLRHALAMLLECDSVALLPGWEASRGARVEVDVAHALGMTCLPVDVWIRQAYLSE